MAIREIFRYIEEHKYDIPKEKIREVLKKQGHSEEDVEGAFLMSDNAEKRKLSGKEYGKPQRPLPRRPTLWGAIVRKEEGAPEAENLSETEKKIETPEEKRTKQRYEFFMGLLLPPAFYVLTRIAFVFIELFYDASSIVRPVSIGSAVLVSFVLYAVFKNTETRLKTGLKYGLILLFLFFLYGWLSEYFETSFLKL